MALSEAKSAFSRHQTESCSDPLKIVVSIIFDLDPPAILSMVNGDVRREMLLQPIL